MTCGRIRKSLRNGWNQLVDKELAILQVAALQLEEGELYTLRTTDREYGCVLIYGECEVESLGMESCTLGPRLDPFRDKAHGILVTRDEEVTFRAISKTLIGIGSAPANQKCSNIVITPDLVGGGSRGAGNWQRDVSFVIWTDNSEGNSIIMGETVTPSGNWSTMPPHRHQYDTPGEEVPYEEAYFFQFSKPQGFGLVWQFDDEGEMDQAFSIKENDVIYMDKGYHPTACGPGAAFYQLTLIAGPHRTSKSKVHKDYEFLLEENNMENPYAKQYVK